MSEIRPDQLDAAIGSLLDDYLTGVNAALDDAGERTITTMVDLTKASAPVGQHHRKGRSRFRASIAWRKDPNTAVGESSFTWHVKKPNYRITHLLENGHASRNGGFVAGRHFVRNAYQQVISDYESAIAEAVKG